MAGSRGGDEPARQSGPLDDEAHAAGSGLPVHRAQTGVSGSQGVQAGDHNTQVNNYFIGENVIADKLAALGVAGSASQPSSEAPAAQAGAEDLAAALRPAETEQQSRGSPASTPRAGKALAGIVTAALAGLTGLGYLLFHLGSGATGVPSNPAAPVARQFIYTARTGNDAPITLPVAVVDDLRQIGLDHQWIALTRVDSTGDVSTTFIDMGPASVNTAYTETLIDRQIDDVQAAVNSPATVTGVGQALYAGLTRTDFTGVPVTIISSGLDLTNPDDFRSLQWTVPSAQVVANVRRAGDLPALHSAVTFVMVPTATPQPQLGQAQKKYLKTVWTALLSAAGASSVTFIDAYGTSASQAAPSAPVVPVPSLPETPVSPNTLGTTR